MPEGMNKQLVSVSNRQDGVPTQEEVFTDNPSYKWHEFYNMDTPPSGFIISREKLPKVHVELNKADQLYYYLPKRSTEARCFFTDKVGGKEHTPRSNFLDRVNPPKPRYDHHVQQASLAPARQVAAKPTVPRPQPPPSSLHNFQQERAKPYMYKPRTPAQPNMLAIDTQALANQQNFTAQAGRQGSYPSLFDTPPQAQDDQQSRRLSHSGSDSGSTTPLRPFSQDQYYSNRILPAAFPGEYSNFRRVSVGAQQRPNIQHDGMQPNYKSVSQQRSDIRRQSMALNQVYAPAAPMMGYASGPGVPSPYGPVEGATQSSMQYHQSPYGAPPAPMMGVTPAPRPLSRCVSQDYVDNLRKYP
jgi:hypothetical protein